MTTSDCTASSADLGNKPYPTLLTNTVPQRIAEDTGEYTTTPAPDAALTQELKRLEVKANGKALAGQITRLYGLVSLLLPNELPQDRTGEELKQMAIELEQAVTIIEGSVNELLETVVDETVSNK